MSHIYYVHKDDFEQHQAMEAERQVIQDELNQKMSAFLETIPFEVLSPENLAKYNAEEGRLYEELKISERIEAISKKYGPLRISTLCNDKTNPVKYGSQEARRDYYSMYRGGIWFKPGEGLTDDPSEVGSLGGAE